MDGGERGGVRVLDRSLLEWLVVTVFCALIAAAATSLGWMWRMDQAAYDAAMSLARPAADDEVVIVAIDDASLAEIGRWPWRRSVHAALIERLSRAGAKLIAFDVIVHEPSVDKPEDDRALAEAIAASGRVVLPVVQATHVNRIVGEAPPAPVFQAGAAALGHIHVEFDPDGIARSVYLWEGFGAPRYPQLGLAVLRLTHPDRAAGYGAPASVASTHWQRAHWLRIPFAGPPGTYRSVSYADVLRGDLDAAILRDKVVFVGATALGMSDSVPTPTSGFNRPMPGVEVNATVYSALKRGEGIRLVSPVLAGALAAAIVVTLMVMMLRTAPRAALVWAFAGAAGTLALMWASLQFAHLWLPLVGAVFGCMLCYPLWSWRRLEAAQRYVDDQLDILHHDAAMLFPAMRTALPEVHDMDAMQRRIHRVSQAVQRQRELRHFIAETLDGLPVGAVVANRDGDVLLCNREAMSLLQARSTATLPEALARLEWPPGVARVGALPAPDETGRTATFEIDAPGEKRLLAQVAGLCDADGVPIGVVLGLSDISRIRDAQRSREETMHYLSHDLRSPIASILTLIEAEKLASSPGPEMLEFLRQTGRYAHSALRLADDLFRLVRADAIDKAQFGEFGLGNIIQDAVDEVWVQAKAKSVTLRVRGDDAQMMAASVLGDQELVRRALVNLLGNAIKFGPAGGEVAVSLQREGAMWAVSVRDQGEGISAEQMPRLFRRFGRLKTAASRRESGIGLGLMIVKTVAERHGGRVEVASEPGAGATFTLLLPACAAPEGG